MICGISNWPRSFLDPLIGAAVNDIEFRLKSLLHFDVHVSQEFYLALSDQTVRQFQSL